MSLDEEQLGRQLPYYLTAPQKTELVDALSSFNHGRHVNYYISQYENVMLQGDCWPNLPVMDINTGERKDVKGVILSNSCDISSGNTRIVTPKIVFAPIVSLNGYLVALEEEGLTSQQINAKADSIRRQEITSIFYLPQAAGLNGEAIIILDDLHSVPSDNINPENSEKIFTLSMVGFYIFLFKLSIHFCRMHEKVQR